MPSCVDLRADRHLAMVEFVTERAGTLEVPLSFAWSYRDLPDTEVGIAAHQRRAYWPNGNGWPRRIMLTEEAA